VELGGFDTGTASGETWTLEIGRLLALPHWVLVVRVDEPGIAAVAVVLAFLVRELGLERLALGTELEVVLDAFPDLVVMEDPRS
jgi:hypothetical protein